MSFQTRKPKILEIIEQNGSVEVQSLAFLMRTSEITIRRDLNTLAEDGLVYRTHGGAMKISLTKTPIDFANKSTINADLKDEICVKAAKLIQDGDIVFLDCGSTVFRMCPYIKSKKIKVVTNSLPIVNELLNTEVQVNFAGGEIDAERQAAHGKIANEHITRYKANKAFLGVDGISIKNGLSSSSEKEAEMTMTMANNALETFFLCDSTKFEKDKYLPFAEISYVKNLITDSKIPLEIADKYTSSGLNLQ
ncbi:DeoR/GlpR transcriptional regulator [Lacihabitans sp. LS3-19]|uniref:DeoR/GlpR family DNA-binding transcription regulator n=1 Tax=Lacihabitans sp. LS3-19 TaxID=2487335 RepID=UPI0020CDCE6B|nr:DeoR/GlpR family DNA-binding transcription regulator [Lacihabitans sp. LS3-19]MCP9768557.1 DeoR/GlpR transcriptional regulator [Lacihabitans sp. LS3-19]